MAQFIYLFIILAYCSCVYGEGCVTYNFENGLDLFSNEVGVCTVDMQPWVLQNYSSISVDGPNESSVFIQPSEELSCVSSFLFPMESNGVVEVNIFMESPTDLDSIQIITSAYVPNGKDFLTGSVLNSAYSPSFIAGWHTIRISLIGPESFNGYITFLGTATEKSIVLVDSFRYIPPGISADSCIIYEDNEEIEVTTTEAVLTTITAVESETIEERCTLYDFENDFDNLFNNKGLLCTGFLTWNQGNYSSLQIQSPHTDSEIFISPNEDISCVSSFVFPVEVSGVLEVNIYMDSISIVSDQVTVFVMKSELDGNDLVTGTATLSPLNTDFVLGWNVVRLQLTGSGRYNGYITIMGMAGENSTVLVDSFRYIPPSKDEELCQIYEVVETEPVTTKPAIEDCVIYNIKDDFDEVFDKSKNVCTGYLPWNLNRYDSAEIDSPSPNSELYISASEYSNCISSFSFIMSPAGRLEVKVFMDSVDSRIDNIIVLAKKVVDDGIDTVNGFVLHTPTNDDFVEGWQIINVTLNDFGSFDGYVTFIGTAAPGSTVLVDSFRYIPPFADEDTC